jgi:hypothetical protein
MKAVQCRTARLFYFHHTYHQVQPVLIVTNILRKEDEERVIVQDAFVGTFVCGPANPWRV